ncbi:hypothetical protein MNBD_GAMMA05-880 [hydrothermal vent metagenome]|uniref:CRISPR-associated protein Cas2 n=1 Tax=hydrothermal vent metagenome TaxID=652676 RepID=A0A3B0X733_9ZZZZ
MALYFLTYDLAKSKSSQALLDELKQLDALRILKAKWCFSSDSTSAKELRNRFKSVVDDEVSFLLFEVSDWASLNLDVTPNDL